jgi:adenine-specific DNA-methyltransferase
LILALTKKNDLVVDPFLGAGTTAVAAVLHGRRCAGAEIVSGYLTIARERVRQSALGKLRYRSRLTRVFTPPANTKLTTSPFVAVAVNQPAVISQAL